MSILNLYADTIDAAADRDFASPPAPETGFSAWSFAKAGMKSPARGMFDVLGNVADYLSTDPVASARRPGDAGIRRPEDDARAQAARDYWKQAGAIMRQKADSFSPDPQTAHTADQVISGVGSGITRAVGAIGTLGPAAGATAFGLSEADTTYQRLIDKGVEPGAAAKVAGVTGVAAGVGAVLPMAGPTVAKTLGLVAAGGPGLYAAQEIMARSILQKAGETAEAGMHDPLDPLGLALSVAIPGVFGGAHIAKMARAARQPAPTLAGVVESLESGGRRFGADGQVLTSPKGAQGEMQVMPATARDPGFGVAPAKDGSAEELARVGRDYIAALEHKYGDADKALAAYNAGPGAVDAAIAKHGDDWLAHLPDETQKYVAKGRAKLGEDTVAHAADDPATVDAARVLVGERRVAESLPDEPGAYGEMLRAGDSLAAGEMPRVEPVFERPSSDQVHLALRAVAETMGLNIHEPPLWKDIPGATDGMTFAKIVDAYGGRPNYNQNSKEITLPDASVEDYKSVFFGSKEDVLAHEIGHAMADNFGITGSFAGPSMKPLRDEMRAASKEFRPEVWGAHKGHAQRDQEMLADALATWLTKPDKRASMPLLSDFLGDRMKPYEPLTEALRPREAQPNRLPPSDSITAEPPKPAATDTLSTLDAERVKTLAAEQPDMMVTLPGHDEPMRLADAMETARQEADLIRSDADLVRAATMCALANGAI